MTNKLHILARDDEKLQTNCGCCSSSCSCSCSCSCCCCCVRATVTVRRWRDVTGGYLGKDRRHTLSTSTAQINCVGQGVAGLGSVAGTGYGTMQLLYRDTPLCSASGGGASCCCSAQLSLVSSLGVSNLSTFFYDSISFKSIQKRVIPENRTLTISMRRDCNIEAEHNLSVDSRAGQGRPGTVAAASRLSKYGWRGFVQQQG